MSTKYTRRSVILAKLQTTYGTPVVPTGANAILCLAPDFSFDSKTTQREFMRASFSNSGFVVSSRRQTIGVTVELKGADNAVDPVAIPYFDPLTQSCSMIGASITVIPVSDGLGFTIGETITGTLNHGILAGFTNMYLFLKAATGTFTSSETLTGSLSDNTTTSWGASSLRYGYYPTSDESLQRGCDIYYYMDGILHKVTSARGSFSLDFTSGAFPSAKFQMTGLMVMPTDMVNPTNPVYALHQPPLCVSAGMKIGNFTPVGVSKASLDSGLNVVAKEDMQDSDGLSAISITKRDAKLSLTLDVDTLSNFNPQNIITAGTLTPVSWSVGSANGNRVHLVIPEAQLESAPYEDIDGRVAYTLNFVCTGNDSDFLIMTS